MPDYVIGVDLGGTNVRAAVVDKNEKVVAHARNPSAAREGADRVVAQTALTIQQAVAEAKLSAQQIGGVGMAVPGHIDTRTGTILWSPNFGEVVNGTFRVFDTVPFAQPVSQAIGMKVAIGNDANVAALGEFRYGAGRAVHDLVMFTLGTGIGSGVVVDDRLIVGSTGGAVELGHHVIVAGGDICSCGEPGHLEAYCGQHAIIARAHKLMATGRPTTLTAHIDNMGEELTPLLIDQCAEAGDVLARQVFDEVGYYLGLGIGNSINIFNPAVVVIGGGIRKAVGLLAMAERTMRRHCIVSMGRTAKLVEAELGEDAGVMGAAELAWRSV